MTILHIVIPSIRKDFIGRIVESIYDAEPHDFEIRLHLMLQSDKRFHLSKAFEKVNEATDMISDGWIWTLSDDMKFEPKALRRFSELIRDFPDKKCIVFSSQHGQPEKIEFKARPEKMIATKVGGDQYIIKRELIGMARHDYLNYGDCADGEFIFRIFQMNQDKFLFNDEILVNFNYYFWDENK